MVINKNVHLFRLLNKQIYNSLTSHNSRVREMNLFPNKTSLYAFIFSSP